MNGAPVCGERSLESMAQQRLSGQAIRCPGPGPFVQVSTESGAEPVWSRDGTKPLVLRGGEVQRLIVVENWATELRAALLPGGAAEAARYSERGPLVRAAIRKQ
jgi:hypothetical protein